MNLSRINLIAILLFVSLLVAACSVTADPGEVVFQDDFSRPVSGWDRYNDPTYSSDYYEGGYRIHVLEPNTDAWASPRLDLADVQIEVDATKLGGPDDNVFGVLCRYKDSRNFYFFLVSSDGYTGIGVYKDGRRRLLTDDSLLPSEAVNRGNALNHIRADCDGYQLRLHVNGILVAEAQAAEWPRGDVGLIAGTYDQAGTEILFDNFSVLQPEPRAP
ncbi:MAG: hypothetical protein J4N76_03185 [Chloroflexi bacterium]|nr:hypothetical protein [Chloroflexota bacterium]MDK1044652.1 hypothetical protein [Anaerolineales bacterium]MCI0772908.1 hypothetical protein [Chloroflexota bacterium]MCI0805965.1 hypothetical protein [Chloroflexota bacterium]MCI0827245.1 hypothetical protein [Chloroflexota bacterium]